MDEIGKTDDSTLLPVVREGEVYLPEKRRLEPDSAAFLAEVASCLPPDVAGTVAARRRTARRGYRRIEIALILVALAGIAWLVCRSFPQPLPARPFLFEWRYDGPRFPTDSPELGRYRKVRTDFDAGRYEAVIRELNDPLATALWQRNVGGNEELFYLYFVSCGKSVSPETDWRRAAGFADELVKSDPDNLQWRYLRLLLERRKLESYSEFYQSLRRAPDAAWERHLAVVRSALRELRLLRGKVQERKEFPGDRGALLKRLDLWEAEFLVFAWMLEGGRGSAVFPDNADSPGVADRETAWLITRDYPDDTDALELRRFILTVLLEQDKPLNRIYWNGEPRSVRVPLEEELHKIDARLAAAKEAK